MLTTLIDQAKSLPSQIENLIQGLTESKQSLYDAIQSRASIEAEIAGAVASEDNGRGYKRYPNEETRKAEIVRRLANDKRFLDADALLRASRDRAAEYEAKLERSKMEHQSAVCLLGFLGNALAAGRQDLASLVLGQESQDKEAQDKEALDNRSAAADTKEALAPSSDLKDQVLTIKAKVLEIRPGRSEGTIRAYVQTETGKEVIYAKNGTGKRLAASIGEEVTVKAKQLDKGFYAVTVNE